MSNYQEVLKLIEQADKLMAKVDDSFKLMERGGIISTSRGMTGLIANLRSSNKLFKKLDRLTKEAKDTYTDEEKKAIEAKALELTAKYNRYYALIDQANQIAKSMVKAPVDAAANAAKGTVDTIKSAFGNFGKKEDAADEAEEPGKKEIDGEK